MRKMFELKPLTGESKKKNMNLILAACNDITALEKLFEISNYQLDDTMKDRIIDCVLEWSKRPVAEQNQAIHFLIAKGARYSQYFVNVDSDPDLMSRLIDCGADVNVNYQGYSALHAAVISQYWREAIKLLLEKGANLNVLEHVNNFGTPLHIAIANEVFDTVLYLMDLAKQKGQKIDYSLKDKEGKTLLIIAAKVMSLEIVTRILSEDKNCVNLQDNDGRTALHFACILGQPEIVQELLRAGADINIRDNNGNTPAHYAVASSPSIKAVLISIHIDPERDYGAKRNAIYDIFGRAFFFPLEFLKQMNLKSTQLVTESTDKNKDGEILSSIENMSYLKKVVTLTKGPMELKCLQEQIDSIQGETIAQACAKGHLPVVKLLIQNGADVTCQNKSGKTPSNIAFGKEKDLLLHAENKIMQARPNPLDPDGNPTINLKFYDPEFAKSVLCSK